MAIDRAGTTTSRLTVDDWVQAGFAIIAEQGIKALKIDRLCSRLAVTKGSFYWHFTDIAGYRSTLIEAWGELRDDDRRHFGEMAPIPPRERLSQMMSALLSARHWTLERAMREWAEPTTPSPPVSEQPTNGLDAARRAFLDFGFDAEDADLRANATFAAGIGFLHLSGETPNARGAARRERFLDLMLTR
jgi:AcrR family transcriptional regulator